MVQGRWRLDRADRLGRSQRLVGTPGPGPVGGGETGLPQDLHEGRRRHSEALGGRQPLGVDSVQRRCSAAGYSSPPPSIRRRERQDSTESTATALISDPAAQKLPIDNTDSADPTEPIDNTEPTEPMDSTEPRQPMHNTESSE